MGIYRFLAGLPAILGVAGFFAYLWVGQSRVGGEMLKRIVTKLRADPNIDIERYGALTPAKLKGLIATDERVRHGVNQGDRDLLRLLIVFQYLLAALVLVVCAALVGVSIWLYARPEPFSLTQVGPKAVAAEALGQLVELDPIDVAWTYRGTDQSVSVFLENVDTGDRTAKKTVLASARSVRFAPAELLPVLKDRSFHGKNRVRSVAEWAGGHSASDPQDLLVGIEVDLMLFGRLATPGGQVRDIHTLYATIDRSTENMPHDYRFSGDFVASTKGGPPIVVPLQSDNVDGEVRLPDLSQVDWARPTGFVYGGPDRPEIVRAKVSGKPPPTAAKVSTRPGSRDGTPN